MKQASASKQVETGNYTTAYQKGFTLRSQGVEELATESNRAIIDTQTGQAVKQQQLLSTLSLPYQKIQFYTQFLKYAIRSIVP
ncbi:MAG: hypothetical protein GX799_03100 [Crenarchaeota archaeon]|jgi:predicted transcriptional regulator|nr:hypothetical protein [Thermoproteota archaeon]